MTMTKSIKSTYNTLDKRVFTVVVAVVVAVVVYPRFCCGL